MRPLFLWLFKCLFTAGTRGATKELGYSKAYAKDRGEGGGNLVQL